MEKGRLFLLIALLGCLSLGAFAEETLQTIQNMHRARAFASGEVAREDLELILKSGVSTAVQLERQPWKFVAITDAELLEQLDDESQQMLDALQAEADASAEGEIEEALSAISAEPGIGKAPAAIVIYADTSACNADFDCGAACQNMIHTASSLGYSTAVATAPLGVLNGEQHDAYCAQFDIDGDMTAAAVLLLGYAEGTDEPEMFDVEAAMADKVRYVE